MPMLSLDQLLDILWPQAVPVADIETVDIHDALGRVAAEEVFSRQAVPGHDNSAMDGYAFDLSTLQSAAHGLPVSQRIAAGQVPEPLQPGTCARIFTGGFIPPGADTVGDQEAGKRQRVRAVGKVSQPKATFGRSAHRPPSSHCSGPGR